MKNSSSMPDPLAKDHEKKTPEYGLKVAKAIQEEWFGGGFIEKGTTFVGRNLWINSMRLYARGEQDTAKYKNFVARQQEDMSYLNLDWTPINIAEKFVNIVSNSISDDNYHLDVQSVDRFALLEKKKTKINLKSKMMAKPMMEKVKEMFGVDLTPKGYLPEDEEELDLYMEIKERPKTEIGEEILVNFIKKTNDWFNIKQKADRDLVESGISVCRIYTDPNDGVKLDYVDPEVYGHSYVEKNDFSDAYYHFWVETITISDIRREWRDVTDNKLRDIAKLYHNLNSSPSLNYDTIPIHSLLDYRIQVMRYCYKTSKEIVYKKYLDKKNRTKKVAKRDSTYEVPEGAELSRLSKSLDTWYEGSYIVGSNEYIWDWKECENLAKDEMNKVMSPFVTRATSIYKNRLKSFLDNIIPFCDQMQYVHLKIQHLMAELKPDLVVLDLDMLADLSTDTKGEGKSATWQTALSILNVKGVVIQKRIDMGEEGVKEGQGARTQAVQQGSGLAALLNMWAHYYNALREVTGINPAKDGTANPNSLVGVNQMMVLAANTATKHIIEAALDFDLKVCETISARVKGIFSIKEADAIQKLYTQAIGKHNLEAIEPFKNRHMHEFGFVARLMPTKEEIDELRQDLSIGIQEGSIDISEKAEIMRIARTNLKQAEEYMRFLRRRKIKEKQKEAEEMQRLQSESNSRAAQEAAQSKVQAYGLQKEIDLEYEGKLSEIELRKRQAEHQIDAPIDERDFQWDAYKEQLKAATTMNLAKYKEQAKDMRLKDQSTHQSKLVDQRKTGRPPIDFKQEEVEMPEILQ